VRTEEESGKASEVERSRNINATSIKRKRETQEE
jgi:hypothetical protein